MRWKGPSERVQFWIAAPVAIPIAVMAAPVIMLAVGVGWLSLKLFPYPPAEWHRWYAWRPVKAEIEPFPQERWFWLEHVERRGWYNRTLYREIATTEEAAEGEGK